jgi:type I restriction enzyme S subunit
VNNENDIKWVSIKDMGNSGTYIFNTSECLTQEAIDRHNVNVIRKNTVILSFKLTVGRVSITTENMCTNEAIAHFELKDKISSEYLYLHLKIFDYDSLGSTSSIATAVNSKIVKKIPILIPSPQILNAFNHMVKDIFNKIKFNSSIFLNLENTRDTLLPKLLSGELDISQLESDIATN